MHECSKSLLPGGYRVILFQVGMGYRYIGFDGMGGPLG